MTRTPIDWTFDGHPIYPPEPDLPLPQFHAESTITLAFGFAPDTKTGVIERRAAGDPASVAERLDAARERMQSASVPTLAQIREKLGPLADAEVLGIVKPRPGAAARARLESTQQGRDLMAQNRPCRCGPDGCSASDCAGKA